MRCQRKFTEVVKLSLKTKSLWSLPLCHPTHLLHPTLALTHTLSHTVTYCHILSHAQRRTRRRRLELPLVNKTPAKTVLQSCRRRMPILMLVYSAIPLVKVNNMKHVWYRTWQPTHPASLAVTESFSCALLPNNTVPWPFASKYTPMSNDVALWWRCFTPVDVHATGTPCNNTNKQVPGGTHQTYHRRSPYKSGLLQRWTKH